MEIAAPRTDCRLEEPSLRLLKLRELDPADVVRDYSQFTRDRFSRHDSLPVVIPALNEERDLPATLLALARSNVDICPIVVDNGSTDETSLVAKAMGALTITESEPSKVRATQEGIDQAKRMGYKRILFTDADTLVGKKWAAAMYGLAEDIDMRTGGIVAGGSFFDHGGSRPADSLRSLNCYLRDVSRKFSSTKLPFVRGFNFLLILDADDLHYKSIQDMPSNMFPGEDFAIRDAVVKNGGVIKSSLSPETLVFTRGDRYRSLASGVLVRLGLRSRDSVYSDQYQGLDFETYRTEHR